MGRWEGMGTDCVSEGFRNTPSRTEKQLLGVASELRRTTGHKIGRGGSDTAGGGVQWSWPQRETIFSILLRSIVGEPGSSEGEKISLAHSLPPSRNFLLNRQRNPDLNTQNGKGLLTKTFLRRKVGRQAISSNRSLLVSVD